MWFVTRTTVHHRLRFSARYSCACFGLLESSHDYLCDELGRHALRVRGHGHSRSHRIVLGEGNDPHASVSQNGPSFPFSINLFHVVQLTEDISREISHTHGQPARRKATTITCRSTNERNYHLSSTIHRLDFLLCNQPSVSCPTFFVELLATIRVNR